MEVYEYDSTATPGTPKLTYKLPDGLTVLISGTPIFEWFDIPLLVTSFTGPARKAAPVAVTTLPGLDLDVGAGGTFGGTLASEGTQALPRLTVQGTIDTPMTLEPHAGMSLNPADPNFDRFPYSVTDFIVNNTRWHYAKFIIACLEGRAPVTPIGGHSFGWKRVDPVSFTDQYGRVYNKPKIADFTASYIEGVPGRTNFTMELIL